MLYNLSMIMKKDFIWGAASAAYQVEGAWNEDGKTPSIWDEFTHDKKAYRGQTGDLACDHYHRMEEDVALMSESGIGSYRFSVSWPRVMPAEGVANEKGINFYNRLIDALLKNGIKPMLTLYHWDMPVWVYEKGGFLNRDTIKYFADYAALIADNFGDRVKTYITINEPQCVLHGGLYSDALAPGVKLTLKELLLAAHNLLLCHGEAVRVIRERVSNAKIGLATCGWVTCPADNSPESFNAAYEDFFKVWKEQPMNCMSVLADPVYLGDYPKKYYEYFKDELPKITAEDLKIISSPLDFIGQNIYSGFFMNGRGEVTPFKYGSSQNDMGWDDIPEAVYYGLKFLHKRYNLPIIITENGTAQNDRVCLDGKVHDYYRIDHTARYLLQMKRAVDEGIPVNGYYHWSLTDNFEWKSGFKRFGLIYIDYETQKRIKKDSFYFYKKVIESNGEVLLKPNEIFR